jgi:Zn finger protein HypA/HybF involved in hydrogenase expression
MKNRKMLKCSECGAEILTEEINRRCYKCESEMIFIKNEWEIK